MRVSYLPKSKKRYEVSRRKSVLVGLSCAISALIPFSLPLNVGGKSENIANSKVCPATALALDIEMVKLFSVLGADVVGVSMVDTCVQEEDAVNCTEEVAKLVPSADCKPISN
jgi:copper oxidase (laccase) domain-containing protein